MNDDSDDDEESEERRRGISITILPYAKSLQVLEKHCHWIMSYIWVCCQSLQRAADGGSLIWIDVLHLATASLYSMI
jgi:hypothetical protein